jgi:uncharacterized protein YjdB
MVLLQNIITKIGLLIRYIKEVNFVKYNNLINNLREISSQIKNKLAEDEDRNILLCCIEKAIDHVKNGDIESAFSYINKLYTKFIISQSKHSPCCHYYLFLEKLKKKLLKCYLDQPVEVLEEELMGFINQRIQILTVLSPPAGRPPNITGILREVKDGIVKLALQNEHEDSDTERIGVYKLSEVIGFIPATEEDSECGHEDESEAPFNNELKKLIDKNIKLFISESTTERISITGILQKVEDGYVKIKVEKENEIDIEPELRVYQTDYIVGFSQSGSGSIPGMVTLEVTVQWPEGVEHPEKVDVILTREEVDVVVETIDGIATFTTEPSGDVILRGEPVPGFEIPIKEIRLTGNQKYVTETLEYQAADIPVEGVILNQEELELIVGSSEELSARIQPPNVSNQNISWQSSDENIATVSDDGLITAVSTGNATITVTTEDGQETDSAEVRVVSIEQILEPTPITALRGEVIVLPEIVRAKLSNENYIDLAVTWSFADEVLGGVFEVPLEGATTSYTLTGDVEQTEQPIILTINVEDSQAVPVTAVSLDINQASLLVAETLTLTATIYPEDATTTDIVWSSSNEEVATVTDGIVKAITPGIEVITVTTIDGGYEAYCQVSVSSIPELELIYATQEVYDSPEEVTISVENLVEFLELDDGKEVVYYVKVEQSGSNRSLNSGDDTVIISNDSIEFNLYDVTEFETTQSYSKEYFVYMSTDPEYPKADEQTLMTNFKVGSPVPIVPKENVRVNLEILGGLLEGQPQGMIFILAREIDKEVIDITWEDYIDPEAPEGEIEFIDEVKLIGSTDSEGNVIWEEPRESLKLGGYFLLVVTPEGYIDNLNLVNPESEDGELLKEVHLIRGGAIERDIINTYLGE